MKTLLLQSTVTLEMAVKTEVESIHSCGNTDHLESWWGLYFYTDRSKVRYNDICE